MAEGKLIKELELGIRELFRILIPGAYVLLLAQLLAPDLQLTQFAMKSTSMGLAASFFLGVIGYALRPHERWAPFFMQFEKYRKGLKLAIEEAIGASGSEDNVDLYKYFLETEASDLNDRIHYFSSFYYMLVELALFSGMAAFAWTIQELWPMSSVYHPTIAKTAMVLVFVGILGHLGLIFPTRSIRNSETKIFLIVALLLVGIGTVTLIIISWRADCIGWRFAFTYIAWTPLSLMVVGYLFQRLADKHWRQIIQEQIVLVNHRKDKLRLVANRNTLWD